MEKRKSYDMSDFAIYFHNEIKPRGIKFRSIFGMDPHRYIDPIYGFNIMKLDDTLHVRHGQYEDDGYSMKTFIEKQYGQEAVELVEFLIGFTGLFTTLLPMIPIEELTTHRDSDEIIEAEIIEETPRKPVPISFPGFSVGGAAASLLNSKG